MHQESPTTPFSEPLIRPPQARKGKTVAIVSPSFHGLTAWPGRARRAINNMEALGMNIRVMPNAARHTTGWTAGSPQERADDIHAAFLDDDVDVVLVSDGAITATKSHRTSTMS